ncbi:MAG: YlbF family regulator [Methylocystaceae bacterium]
MINIYDKAHELARELKKTEEYQAYLTALQQLKLDEQGFNMVKDIRTKQVELQQAALLGAEVPPDKLKALEVAHSLAIQRPAVAAFFTSEMGLVVIINDIEGIIQGALSEGMDQLLN